MSETQVSENEDDFDPNTGTTPVINVGSGNVKFALDSYSHVMRPREIRWIPTAYALPRKMQTNSPPLPSVVELLTGRPAQVIPVTHRSARGVVAELEKQGKLDESVTAFIARHDRQAERNASK